MKKPKVGYDRKKLLHFLFKHLYLLLFHRTNISHLLCALMTPPLLAQFCYANSNDINFSFFFLHRPSLSRATTKVISYFKSNEADNTGSSSVRGGLESDTRSDLWERSEPAPLIRRIELEQSSLEGLNLSSTCIPSFSSRYVRLKSGPHSGVIVLVRKCDKIDVNCYTVRFITGREKGAKSRTNVTQKHFDLEFICSAVELKAMANDRKVSCVECNSEQDTLSLQPEASRGDISGLQSKSTLPVKLNHQESALSLNSILVKMKIMPYLILWKKIQLARR
jgi:hypothetical protein